MEPAALLFTPGPVMTSDRVRATLARPDISHRRHEFETLLSGTQRLLLSLSGATPDHVAVVLTGSGSAANESVLSSVVRPSDEVLIISNGPFGERLVEIATCHQLRFHVLGGTWGKAVDVDALEAALAANPAIKWVCMSMHETGTGQLNPVNRVGQAVRRHGRHFFVDAVSAFAAEDLHLERDHVDVCTSVGNKAVGGIAGVSFIVANTRVVPPLGPNMPKRSVYLSLQNLMTWAQSHSQTPNTPAVTAIAALHTALEELAAETVLGRRDRMRALSHTVRVEARKMGLKLLLPEEEMSSSVTSLFLPEGVQVDAFIAALHAKGFVVYPGKGPLHDANMFQIATMGRIDQHACHRLMATIADTIAGLQRAAA